MPLITALEARLKALEATGAKTGAGLGGPLATGARQAGSSMLALQQAQARLEVQQGNLVGAANRLRAALAATTTTTTQTIAARRQLLAVEQQLATGQSGLARAFNEAGAAARSSLTSMIGPAALVTTGLTAATAVAKSFADAFVFKAELDATTAGINSQLAGVRDMSVVWSEANATAQKYRITQAETNAILASSVDVLRTSRSSVGDLEIALLRLGSRDPSKPISEAARALRELNSGDTATIKELFNIGAADALRMKNEIAGGADAVQVLTSFLDRAGSGMDILAQRTTGAVGAMNDLKLAQEELTLAQGEFAQGPGLVILNTRIETTRGLTRLLSGDFATMQQSFTQAAAQGGTAMSVLNTITNQNSANQAAAAQNTLYHQSVLQGLAGASQAASQAMQQQAAATAAANAPAAALAAQQQAAAAAMASGTVIISDQSGKLTELAQVTQAAAGQSLLDTEAKALQTQQTQVLQEQTRLAVDAFMQLHPNISASGAASLVMAGQLDPLIGQLVVVRLRAQEAQAALLAVANARNAASVAATVDRNRATGGGLSSGEEAERAAAFARATQEHNKAVAAGIEQSSKRLDAQADAYKKIRDAQEQQVLATGSAAQQQAVLNARLERARVTAGEQSVAFIQADTALKQFQATQAKGGGGGGGGGGGVKLSDQQKLNNQLLADQEKFSSKSEDAELKHGLKLLAIERATNEKRAAAAKAFQQARLDSDASFYRSIGDIQDSGIQRVADEQWQQALANSEEIGREKGRDAAEAYLEARRDAILADAKNQEAINKALAEGDTGRAEFLTAIQEKDRKSAENHLRQVEEEGSAIENERARQIADEERSYEESSGRIADQAETSAARRIAANERAGKAIDPERLAVQGLTADYERLARAGGRSPTAGSTTGAVSATAPTATTAEAPASPTDLAALLAALQAVGTQVTQAIAATERAVRDGSSQVSSAVSGRAFS